MLQIELGHGPGYGIFPFKVCVLFFVCLFFVCLSQPKWKENGYLFSLANVSTLIASLHGHCKFKSCVTIGPIY